MKNQKKKENFFDDKVTIYTIPPPNVLGANTPNDSAQDDGSKESKTPY